MRRCCARRCREGGRVVSLLSTRCICSCAPFCSGCPGVMNSTPIPKAVHHALNRVSPAGPLDPKGLPLSTRIIAGSKPSFEVHGPYVVASSRHRQAAPPQLRPCRRTATRSTTQLQPPQPVANRPRTGNGLPAIFLAKSSRQFPAAPAFVSAPQTSNPAHPFRGYLPRRAVRPTLPVSQARQSLALEARQPLVATLATHSKTPAHLREAFLVLQSQLHQLQPPHHNRKFFPRHAGGKSRK